MSHIMVLLNEHNPDDRSHMPMLDGWRPEDPMRVALATEIDTREGDDLTVADYLYSLCNDAIRCELADVYRAKGNRSLSVGDVVVIDGRAWACTRGSWARVVIG